MKKARVFRFNLMTVLLALWACGGDSHESEIGQPPPPSSPNAPSAVTDLAVTATALNSVTLQWTAPGDSGNVGTAAQYDLRCALSGIMTDDEFAAGSPISGVPAPEPAGTVQSMTVAGLAPSTAYWFAMKTVNSTNSWSALSNSPSGTTLAPPPPEAPTFTEYVGNPVFTAAGDPYGAFDPCIVKLPFSYNGYVMYYATYVGSTKGEYYLLNWTQSSDGITWEPGRRINVDGYSPVVIRDETVQVFHMWYLSSDFYQRGRIWHAESVNGVDWTNHTLTMDKRIYGISILWEPDHLKLWYVSREVEGPSGKVRLGVRYATDVNFSGTWTELPDPLFTLDGFDIDRFNPTVIKQGNEYWMWYSLGQSIGFATSPDGIHWMHGDPAVGVGGPTSWDSDEVCDPFVLQDGARLRMWYSGRGRGVDFVNRIGLAETR